MELTFTKMHGLGNDFIVIDCRQQPFSLTPEQIQALADRHTGIGFDQLLVIGPASSGKADIGYRIYNSDGGEVSQCGNGARCIASYLHDRHIVRKDEIVAETREGLLRLYRQDDGQVRVNMGVPRLQPADIPLQADQRQPEYCLAINGHDIRFSALSMGNPHAVLQVDDIDTAAVGELGPAIQQAALFPAGVNVGFMQVIDSRQIRLRVYERGAGETLACGSGACAAVVAGILAGTLENTVDVSLQGGHLLVSWQGEGEPVWITGPATEVFEGRMTL
ncbi:MAG TPA: diaminopimelate epimerase [Gammaproteobacteria bacterium]|nr:diaminopimelate epimerase [Gammaproteobacteria bacterium]